MKYPCIRDCPDRSPTCHGDCAAYLEWRKLREAERKAIRDSEAIDLVRRGSYFQYKHKAARAKCKKFLTHK